MSLEERKQIQNGTPHGFICMEEAEVIVEECLDPVKVKIEENMDPMKENPSVITASKSFDSSEEMTMKEESASSPMVTMYRLLVKDPGHDYCRPASEAPDWPLARPLMSMQTLQTAKYYPCSECDSCDQVFEKKKNILEHNCTLTLLPCNCTVCRDCGRRFRLKKTLGRRLSTGRKSQSAAANAHKMKI
jgi:hypothetical protein